MSHGEWEGEKKERQGGDKRPGGRKDGCKKGRRKQDGRDKEERLKEAKRCMPLPPSRAEKSK
jgi:hypothetical protein